MDVGTRFSQDLAFVFSFAIDMAMAENRKEVTYEDVAKSFIENLSENMLEVFSDLEINVPEFKEHYEGAIAEELEEFKIPASLTGCITVLNDKFKDKAQCDILGRDKECEEIWRNMMKKTKRNVILVGKPGVGKSSIVYKLTSDIVNQRCPEIFYDFIVLSLDVNNIIAGTSLRGQAEERFQDLIDLLKKHDNVILFIDEIHMIVGAGAVSHGEKQDLSNALKPILAGDDAIVIGATTDEEYAQTFGMEGALRRRFKTINVREPKTTEVYDMLKESIRQLEEFHEVRISKKMVEMIIFYSACFNYNTSNPDRTKDLIDVAMVTARMSGKDRVDRESIMKNFGANFEEFRNMSEEMVRSTAYHEVGHFIVQRFSDKLIDRKAIAISIVPAEGYLGLTVTDATDKTVNKDKSYFTDLIADLLAGRIAEKVFMKSENNAGAESDLEKATKIAFKMVTKYGMTSRLGENQIYLNDKDYQMQTPAVTEIVNREVQKILEEVAKKATLVLDEHQEVVEELVNELTKKGMLSGKELNSIIELYEQKQAVTV
ncbi:MAG: AAA family ATPase [Clostridia bacterium]